MWVGAAPGATSPLGPLQDRYNSGPRADAIAGIPTRNRDTFAQGTDTLAAAPQSIHQSLKGVATAKGHSRHPSQFPLEGTGPPGLTQRLTPWWRCESAKLCKYYRQLFFLDGANRETLMWKMNTHKKKVHLVTILHFTPFYSATGKFHIAVYETKQLTQSSRFLPTVFGQRCVFSPKVFHYSVTDWIKGSLFY